MKNLLRLVFIGIAIFAMNSNLLGQTKKVEHSIQIGVGPYWRTQTAQSKLFSKGCAMQISYGADFFLGSQWSVMPNLGISMVDETKAIYGRNSDTSAYIDLSVIARYRFASRCIAGLGPMLSYSFFGPMHQTAPFSSEIIEPYLIYKPFSLSLKPQFAVDLGKHWRIGMEGVIGLTKMNQAYEERTMKLYYVLLTLGFRF